VDWTSKGETGSVRNSTISVAYVTVRYQATESGLGLGFESGLELGLGLKCWILKHSTVPRTILALISGFLGCCIIRVMLELDLGLK
jgi:hypothetical protein